MAKSKKKAPLRQAYGQGNKISAFRLITGCTQEWLAFQLGISVAYLAMIERGQRKMNKELRSTLNDFNAWAMTAIEQAESAQAMEPDAATIRAWKNKTLELQLRLADAEEKLNRMEIQYQEDLKRRKTIAVMEKTKPESIQLRGKKNLQQISIYKKTSARASNPEQQILARVIVAKLKAERDVLLDAIDRFSQQPV